MIEDKNLEFFTEKFVPHFNDWIFNKIDRYVISDDALIGFIFMSCVIDYLAGFWWGEDTKGQVKMAYTGFINEYFPIGKYEANDLYDSLRNGLVHKFTIQKKRYALTHNHPDLHLEIRKSQLILNANDFAQDLHEAASRYFSDVEQHPELLKKFMNRFERDGFLFITKI